MPKDPLSTTPERLLEAFDFAAAMAGKEEAHEAEMRALLLSLLDVMDSFDRFLSPHDAQPEPSAGQTEAWLTTSRLIRKQLQTALRQAGVEPVDCLGRCADPEEHEIVEVKQIEGMEEYLIVEEVLRGYTWRGQMLRRPQVAIAGQPTAFEEK